MRSPQDCPDGKETYCFLCNDESCHACYGSGHDSEEYSGGTCHECGGTGKLETQLANAHDPEAAQAAARSRKGWAP